MLKEIEYNKADVFLCDVEQWWWKCEMKVCSGRWEMLTTRKNIYERKTKE